MKKFVNYSKADAEVLEYPYVKRGFGFHEILSCC
jgi:hypothetical protein